MAKDLRASMQAELDEVTDKLVAAGEKLDAAQTRFDELVREKNALTKAIAVLDGTDAPPPTPGLTAQEIIKTLGQVSGYNLPPNIVPEKSSSLKPGQAIVNGETVDIEPGFHVEKNSFGEDCIVPDGVVLTPTTEPMIPGALKHTAVILPPTGAGDTFVEDLPH